jgi:hypothetical protein
LKDSEKEKVKMCQIEMIFLFFSILSIKKQAYLSLSSRSRQVSLDRLLFRTGRQNRVKREETESLTGF